MSTTYEVQSGDTLQRIAEIFYGDFTLSTLISRANPGLNDPLTVGRVLFIPDDPIKLPKRLSTSEDVGENEITVNIDGQRFRYWTALRIRRAIDNIDTIDIDAVFEPNNLEFRRVFKPFTYKTIVIYIGKNPLFTGTLVNISPLLTSDTNTITLNAYSLPGVLNDCMLPLSDDSEFEFFDVNLSVIATSLCQPFGLRTKFLDDSGSNFADGVFIREGSKILPFIVELAKQRELVVSSSEDGELQFQKSVSFGVPVSVLTQGSPPLVSISARFNPQSYYSHVVGIESEEIGETTPEIEFRLNPFLTNVLRPLTFVASDSDETDIDKATDSKFGRMFANAVAYEVTLSTWRDDSGNLFSPNTLITVRAPGVMIYNSYKFIIRNVEFRKTSKSETCDLSLIMIGGFDGKAPESMPWDE